MLAICVKISSFGCFSSNMSSQIIFSYWATSPRTTSIEGVFYAPSQEILWISASIYSRFALSLLIASSSAWIAFGKYFTNVFTSGSRRFILANYSCCCYCNCFCCWCAETRTDFFLLAPREAAAETAVEAVEHWVVDSFATADCFFEITFFVIPHALAFEGSSFSEPVRPKFYGTFKLFIFSS